MNPLISICIPTYQRPELLRQAIASCLAQTYEPIEIIVCDDSKDDASADVIHQLNRPDRIRYYRNQPSLGQAGNVNRLFDLAQGDQLVLLHDDDLLLPDAVQTLATAWESHPNLTACFGKQQVIDMQGQILEQATIALNQKHYRTAQYEGLQERSIWSALVGQFPNNGYLVSSEAAKRIRYRSERTVGHICDYDFGLRLAASYKGFYFVDHYTSMSRVTTSSISQTNNNGKLSYQLLESLQLPEEIESFRQERLRSYAVSAVSQALATNDRQNAIRIYQSRHYPWSKKLAPKGLVHALLLMLPGNASRFLFQALKQ